MELASKATRLTCSSAKASHPVENILLVNTATPSFDGQQLLASGRWWQSEGNLPHHVQFDYDYPIDVQQVSVLLDYSKDESYTPNLITIQAGEYNALLDVAQIRLEEAQGWIKVDMNDGEAGLEDGLKEIFTIRLLIHSNCANGRDSRIRAVQILGRWSGSVNENFPEPDLFKSFR